MFYYIIVVFLCLQTGFGAKAKNLLQLPTEYKGVSWRWDDVHWLYTQHIIVFIYFGYLCYFFLIICKHRRRRNSRDRHYITQWVPPSVFWTRSMLQRHWMAILDHNISSIFFGPPLLLEYLPFFVCLHSDILKKFNPDIKGMSEGKENKHTGFNLAVSGAKISWVNVVLSLDILGGLFPVFKILFIPANLLNSHRGIPGQVRKLIEKMKSDAVSVFHTTIYSSMRGWKKKVIQCCISVVLILLDGGFW